MNTTPEPEPEQPIYIPRKWKCSSPLCSLETRCPGEVCKFCRAQQEAARAAFRRVLDGR